METVKVCTIKLMPNRQTGAFFTEFKDNSGQDNASAVIAYEEATAFVTPTGQIVGTPQAIPGGKRAVRSVFRNSSPEFFNGTFQPYVVGAYLSKVDHAETKLPNGDLVSSKWVAVYLGQTPAAAYLLGLNAKQKAAHAEWLAKVDASDDASDDDASTGNLTPEQIEAARLEAEALALAAAGKTE